MGVDFYRFWFCAVLLPGLGQKAIHEVDCKTEDFCAVGGELVQVVVLADVEHPPGHLLPHVRLHLHLDVLELVGVDRGVALLIPQKVLQDSIVL